MGGTPETPEVVNKARNSDTYVSDTQNGRVSEVSEGTPPTPGQNAPAWTTSPPGARGYLQ